MTPQTSPTSLGSFFSYPRQDLVAGTVVFLVALPLCLGIAIASGVPPVSGLVAGVVGGLVIPLLSRSSLSVSGPAAGLASIVLLEVQKLGGIGPFLSAVVLAGVLQLVLGALKAGRLSGLVPSSVIKGMLAAIGITIVLKQIPVAMGMSGSLFDFVKAGFPSSPRPGSVIITLIALVILFGWKRTPFGKIAFLSPALVVVLLASGMAAGFANVPALALGDKEFVRVPLGGLGALASALPHPELAGFLRGDVWVAGLTIAVVASIETLLSLQAVDRLDPLRRHSPPDRELLAQGVGNTISGLLGGLPMTAVIVRSGANVAAGGRERLSAFFHGLLLLVAVVAAGPLINQIPLAALAAVLLQVGLNLCKPSLFRAQAKLGLNQALPFLITIGAVLATDLLKGVIVGIVVGVLFVLRQNAQDAVVSTNEGDGALRLRFRRDATFITKPALLAALERVKEGDHVVIDASNEYVDQDVKETLVAFLDDASHRKIRVDIVGVDIAQASGGGGH